MAKYGKLNSYKPKRSLDRVSLKRRFLMFLLVFLCSFLILTLVLVYWPLNVEQPENESNDNNHLRYSAEEIELFFTDVDIDDPGLQAVIYLKRNGIIKGYADNTFLPDQYITRAEFIKLMHEAEHIYPHPLLNANCYKDVKKEWFAPFVCSAKEKGWISSEKEYFNPESRITLAEAVKIILVDAKMEIEVDVESAWYIPFMAAASRMGWLEKAGLLGIDPETEINRMQAARLIYEPVRLGFFK
jgi:hypothetical protein